MNIVITYLSVLVPLLILDALWIGIVAREFYQRNLGFLMTGFTPLPAILFYLIYAAGICFFVLRPFAGEPLIKIFLAGAFFGLCAYATYDLTNQATIKEWPVIATLIDISWGAVVTGVVSVIAGHFLR